MIIFTMYGGGFATIPAYLADMFGTRYVGGIHGRLLTAWSLAGVLGPVAITMLRERSIDVAIRDLVTRIDPERFRQAFGAGVEQLDALVAQQTVTIAKLMEIAPAGTVDPTPSLYNLTMYLMAALLAIALVANALMKPVDAKHHMAEAQAAVAAMTAATRAVAAACLAALATGCGESPPAPPSPSRLGGRPRADARHAHRHTARLRDGRDGPADGGPASQPDEDGRRRARRRLLHRVRRANSPHGRRLRARGGRRADEVRRDPPHGRAALSRAHRDRVLRGRRSAHRSGGQARRRDRHRERLLARPESRDARPLLRARRALRRARARRRQRPRAFRAAERGARRSRGRGGRRQRARRRGDRAHEPAWASWSTYRTARSRRRSTRCGCRRRP